MNKYEYVKMAKFEETHWWFVSKRRFISALFPKGKDFKIVDVGCGTGGTTKYLEQYGNVTGIEKNKYALGEARKKGVSIKFGYAEKLPIPDSNCNVVTFIDVLYHKDVNDIEALKEAYRIMRPGGWLIVHDCAFEFLRGPHDKFVEARERYTKKVLTSRIKKAGFIIERASYAYFLIFPLVALVRIWDRIFDRRSESEINEVNRIINNILIALLSLEAKLLCFVSLPWGSSIIIRARKTNE